jgi:hypothetical protein
MFASIRLEIIKFLYSVRPSSFPQRYKPFSISRKQQTLNASTMGSITYSDAIAIAQIVYYSPALLASIFVCVRHGFSKASGWFFLILFCLIRLIGASAELATITNPTSSTAITIALICAVMGTSPLLLSSLGLISRM